MLWLMMIVLTPFVTRLLTEDGAFRTRFILYAAVQVIASLALLMTARWIARAGRFSADAPPDLVQRAHWRSGTFVITFGLSIPIALTGIEWLAFGTWIVVPLVLRGYRLARERAA